MVEGRYDRNTLSQILSSPIYQTDGFQIFHDPQKIAFIRRVQKKQGLVLLLDSDGAGFVIRGHLRSLLPPENLYQAYIPEIWGKEKRKASPSKEHLLGVEGMNQEILVEALKKSGAHFLPEASEEKETKAANISRGSTITRFDLYQLHLSGGEGSAARRDKIKEYFHLPRHLSGKNFLETLNMITSLSELEDVCRQLFPC